MKVVEDVRTLGRNTRAKWLASGSTLAQLLRYGIVGLINNLVGYLVYLLFTYWGTTPKVTMTVLYGVGAVIGFWGNRRLTFAHKGRFLGTGARYAVIQLAGYLLNFSILSIFVDRLGHPHQIVQAIAIFVVAAFLFTAYKVFVFRRVDDEEDR